MSHWKGTWRLKEYQAIEARQKRPILFYDHNTQQLGRNDDELLRIYYFRNDSTKTQTQPFPNNLQAKKQVQVLLQNQFQNQSQQKNQALQKSNSFSAKVKKFEFSSASQSSSLSNFSLKKRIQRNL